ncbi:MAG: APC family permease [Nanoarchaeota archaeon]|nr:APC family permease [Nanoarchaeota archaeon]
MTEKKLKWPYAWGIVFSDIGTSVFYATQVLYPIAGITSFVFVIFVFLMMFIYRLIYMEGGTFLSANGGAYKVVMNAFNRKVGAFVAVFTTISYIATVVISSVSGTYYLQSLIPGMSDTLVLLMSFIPIVFFAYMNIRGLSESARISFYLSLAHFSLLILIMVLGVKYIIVNGISMPPFEMNWKSLGIKRFLFAFGAAHLGITGFESLAQIIEHLEKPLHKTMGKIYSVVILTTGLTAPAISFLILVILSNSQMAVYSNNLVAALSLTIGGRLLQFLIVFDAALILYSAVNTGIVGNTGFWVSLSKDKLFPQRLLRQNKRFGTNHIPIMIFSVMCIMIGIISMGQIELLGAIYGFSFLMAMLFFAVGVIVLRSNKIHRYHAEVYKMPFHINIRRSQFPLFALFGAAALLLAASTVAIRSPFALFIVGLFGIPLMLFFLVYRYRINIFTFIEDIVIFRNGKNRKKK